MTGLKFPNSLETEQHLLGAIILDAALISEAAVLDDGAFYNTRTRRAFQAIKQLIDLGEQLTPLSIAESVGNTQELSVTEITSWTHGIPFQMSIEPLIARLRDKQLKRRLIKQADDVIREAQDESDTAANLAGKAAESFQSTLSGADVTGGRPTLRIDAVLEESYERWERMSSGKIVTVGTGIDSIDTSLTGGGFEKGMFHVIGARPAKGKTSFALDMAWHNIIHGNVTVFFTMELSREVLNDRFVAPLAGVRRWMIAPGWMNSDVQKRLHTVGAKIQHLPLYINAKARTLSDMRIELNSIARQTGGKIDVIIVDFLTKMGGHGETYERVSRNANGLAQFASDYGAAVICLSQLSRKNVEKAGGEIDLSHFRGSGEIEELGRTVLGLYGEDDSKHERDVKCACLKQGEGRTFESLLTFNTDYMTFGTRSCLIAPANTEADV